jgi:hypothetical protein
MTEQEVYEFVLNAAKLDIKNEDGIDQETAYKEVPEGWYEIVRCLYKLIDLMGVKVVRIYYHRGRLRFKWHTDDADKHQMMRYAYKYIYHMSIRRCLITGKPGKHQIFVEEKPPLTWEHALAFANAYYEEHGYDGLFEPDPDAPEKEFQYSIRGRYRGSSPARRFHSGPTGTYGASGERESAERDSTD